MRNRKLLYFLLLISILVVGCTQSTNNSSEANSSDSKIKDKNITIPTDAVVSIGDKIYTKKDFPKEYSSLSNRDKKKFLSLYLYSKVVLTLLKDKEKFYKKDIEIEINKEIADLKRKGIVLDALKKKILEDSIAFNTIAYQEVLKEDKNIDKKVHQFYKKHEKEFDYNRTIEVSHISLKDKKQAEEILKKLENYKDFNISIFAKFAKEYSLDKTKYSGGYVGKIGKLDNKKFFDKLWSLKDNSLAKDIYKKDGYYHIIYILKKHNKEKRTLEQERLNIIKFLLSDEIQKWKIKKFKKAKKDIKVKVFDIKV